jgi:hypothetical protein
VTSISETVTTYTSSAGVEDLSATSFSIFPNPTAEILVVQSSGLLDGNVIAELVDADGKIIQTQTIYQGSTLCYFNVATLYSGSYFLRINEPGSQRTYTVVID